MPKILIVIARLNVGGTSQYIHQLVLGLLQRGFEVLVVTGHVQGSEIEDKVIMELPIRRVKDLGRKISPLADFKARNELLRIIMDYQPNLIYSHTFKAGLLTRSLSLSIPRIHAFHGHLLTDPELAGWKSQIVILIEKLLASRAMFLVTVGHRVSRELVEVGIGKTGQFFSIAPGINPVAREDREKARKELGIDQEVRPIVVWMARVIAVKGPSRVIEIAKAIPEARFLLAGGGNLLESIEKKAPSNLSVIGWQPAYRMWSVADVAISTSKNEGMPIALIEAQLAGIPAVAIDVGSVGEVIVHNETGLLFPEFGTGFIEGLRTMLQNPVLRLTMGQKAKIRAQNQFLPDKMISAHVELFERVLGKKF